MQKHLFWYDDIKCVKSKSVKKGHFKNNIKKVKIVKNPLLIYMVNNLYTYASKYYET